MKHYGLHVYIKLLHKAELSGYRDSQFLKNLEKPLLNLYMTHYRLVGAASHQQLLDQKLGLPAVSNGE